VFLADPRPVAEIHELGQLLVARASGAMHAELELEFFPRQAELTGRGLGNLIKLPLGIHRRSGRRSQLLDAAGRPLADPFAGLRSVRRARPETIAAAIARLGEEVRLDPGATGTTTRRGSRTRAGAAPESSGRARTSVGPRPPLAAPAWTEVDFEADPEVRHLLAHCPVLAELKRRVDDHRALTHDEQTVLRHTLGHLPQGVLAVNHLLERCEGVAPSARLLSPLRGSPTSCARIRQRIPDVAGRVPCACPFPESPERYPTPLLHLRTLARGQGLVTSTSPDIAPPAVAPSPEPQGEGGPDGRAVDVARRYALMLRRNEEIAAELALLRAALLRHLRGRPQGRLALPEGAYVLRQHAGEEAIDWEPHPPHTAGVLVDGTRLAATEVATSGSSATPIPVAVLEPRGSIVTGAVQRPG
jgi:hypothetical protein